MSAPAWENLDAFFDPADFAVSAAISCAGEVRNVLGIYDEPYLNAELGEYDFDTGKPRFLAKEADLVGVKRGDTAAINGKLYEVMTYPQSTGDGLAVLELAKG